MTRFKIVFAALLVSWPLHALAGPAEEASAAIDRWAAAFSANDANALVKLYTPDALLHGIASPTLHAGSEAIGGGADWLIAHHHSSLLPPAPYQ